MLLRFQDQKKAAKSFKNFFRSWIYWYFWKRNCKLQWLSQ